ncbi:MAG: MBL fold metallo-hydrolase RNA specificity domain-containing protein [Promethearchaeota archaeon]
MTGSQHLIETKDASFILDCGLFQGRREVEAKRNRIFGVNPSSVDFAILSHAHLDHCGRLPQFVHAGFRGPIYATAATAELCNLLLEDVAKTEEYQAAKARRTTASKTQQYKSDTPLFTEKDAKQVAKQFRIIKYNKIVDLPGNVSIRLRDAGHILGSSIVETWSEENGRRHHVVFTGDIGQSGAPIIRDPDFPDDATFLISESTYANRNHEPLSKSIRRFEKIIIKAHRHRSHILVPAFAIGRTQSLIYILNELVENERVPIIPVAIDSPLAIDMTKIFKQHRECYDDETWKLIQSGDMPLDFKGLRNVEYQDDSDLLSSRSGPIMIVAGSGMMNGGRILRHLFRRIEDSKTTLLVVGFQAPGTLGHRIVHGSRNIRIYGRSKHVRAKVQMITGFSSHADQTELRRHLQSLRRHPPRQVFCVHGSPSACKALTKMVRKDLRCPAVAPVIGQRFRLA